MKFYIAIGKTREKLLALDAERKKVNDTIRAFVKAHRAAGSVNDSKRLVGLVFKAPTSGPWVPSKRLRKYVAYAYIPDQSKEGKAIRAEMSKLTDPVDGFSVARICGVKPIPTFERSFSPAAFTILCGKVVVGLDDDAGMPKECERISDVEYERLLEKAKAACKKKRK